MCVYVTYPQMILTQFTAHFSLFFSFSLVNLYTYVWRIHWIFFKVLLRGIKVIVEWHEYGCKDIDFLSGCFKTLIAYFLFLYKTSLKGAYFERVSWVIVSCSALVRFRTYSNARIIVSRLKRTSFSIFWSICPENAAHCLSLKLECWWLANPVVSQDFLSHGTKLKSCTPVN